jgi:cytoskeletal protein CcmA (bactofilin family)
MILRRKSSAPESSSAVAPAAREPGAAPPSSILGANSRFSGEVSGRGNLRIDGNLEGAIRLRGHLQIRPAGRAQAEVEVSGLEVRGRVDGRLQISGLFHAASGAEVSGSAVAARWVVEEGARLQGEIRRPAGTTGN